MINQDGEGDIGKRGSSYVIWDRDLIWWMVGQKIEKRNESVGKME